MVRPAEPQAGAQLCQHSMDIRQGAAHPFQACVLDPLTDQRGAYIMIGKNGAIIAFSGFVQLNPEIGDRCRAQLLGHPPFYIPCGLTNLQQAFMGLIRDGISINAGPRIRFWGEDVVDGRVIHQRLSHPRSDQTVPCHVAQPEPR